MDVVEYISYKKVIVFGGEGTGKTTLKNYLKLGKFSDEKPKDESGNQ